MTTNDLTSNPLRSLEELRSLQQQLRSGLLVGFNLKFTLATNAYIAHEMPKKVARRLTEINIDGLSRINMDTSADDVTTVFKSISSDAAVAQVERAIIALSTQED